MVLQGESPIAQAVRSDPTYDLTRPSDIIKWDVERTPLGSSVGGKINSEGPINSPLLSSPDWHCAFADLLRSCEKKYGPTRMHQLPDGSIVLNFGYGGCALSVTFPSCYPEGQLLVAASCDGLTRRQEICIESLSSWVDESVREGQPPEPGLLPPGHEPAVAALPPTTTDMGETR